MKRRAFTLAEVLITLSIIGIVAALTIPALLNSTNDAELKTAWKRMFAEISQVTTQVRTKNGGTFEGVLTANQINNLNFYAQYFNYHKRCYGDAVGNCWPSKVKIITGADLSNNNPGGWGLLLNNGASIIFSGTSSTCNGASFAFSPTANNGLNNYKFCDSILVDVNGLKPPNTVGRDIFGMLILSDRVIPYSKDFSTTPYDVFSLDSNGWGYGLSAEYLKQ